MRLGEITDGLLGRAGVDPTTVPLARRVLIVHTIGSAAFATTGSATADSTIEPTPTDQPIPQQQSQDNFRVSLGWLLTGIVRSDR